MKLFNFGKHIKSTRKIATYSPFSRILPIGTQIKLNYSNDECARSDLIKNATSKINRPTVKLAPVLPSFGAENVAAQI